MATTIPITEYRIVSLAADICFESPFDITYRRPPIMIIITDMAPTRKIRALVTPLNIVLMLEVPQDVPQASPAPLTIASLAAARCVILLAKCTNTLMKLLPTNYYLTAPETQTTMAY